MHYIERLFILFIWFIHDDGMLQLHAIREDVKKCTFLADVDAKWGGGDPPAASNASIFPKKSYKKC